MKTTWTILSFVSLFNAINFINAGITTNVKTDINIIMGFGALFTFITIKMLSNLCKKIFMEILNKDNE